MGKAVVRKPAGALKILVTITLTYNLIILSLVPVLVSVAGYQVLLSELLDNLTAEPPLLGDDRPYFSPGLQMFLAVVRAWTEGFVFTFVLTLSLLFRGIRTAVILWQGRRVLGTILTGAPFRAENGVSLCRATVCRFLTVVATLARVVWGLFYYGSVAPLLTYNTPLVSIFILGSLLCLVMSVLFRQTVELKAENDPII